MKALSIRPIWLHMIVRPACRSRRDPGWPHLYRPKRVENRTKRNGSAGQPCSHRGPLLLHASQRQGRKEYEEALRRLYDAGLLRESHYPLNAPLAKRSPLLEELPAGGIVAYCQAIGHLRPDGTADTVYGELSADEVAAAYELRWWSGGHALLLDDVQPLPFVACPGALNTWQVPEPVLAELRKRGVRFGADADDTLKSWRRAS
ncbi:MAG: ASCH domain-containing protein [Planctomycetota bacterium]|jgi:hypothetical protein